MIFFSDLIKFLGRELSDSEFQNFLSDAFDDLSSYDILESEYVESEKKGIEIGFKDETAIFDDDENVGFEKENPKFSHFNIFPISSKFICGLPFKIKFSDTQLEIREKVGLPKKTNEGENYFLGKYLEEHFDLENYFLSISYDPENHFIKLIQVRNFQIE